ncbi:MAG: hypothetical protein J6Y02_23600 [Pseudobutyrivibrio sp.]|nr:hypothetical protein [Pseudobutyrivibrio sp.]
MSNWYVTYDSSTDILHYGIEGQKWGVRRYQNDDGSYTALGLERYRKAANNYDLAKRAYKMDKTEENKKILRDAKYEKKHSHKLLEKAFATDKGAKLYLEGKTLKGQRVKQVLNTSFIALNPVSFTPVGAGLNLVALAKSIKLSKDKRKLKKVKKYYR